MSFRESDNGSFFVDGKMQTRRDEKDKMILEDVQAIVQGMGCTAVEAGSAHRRGVLHVVLVIYRRGGVDLDTCSSVYKAVYPRLEMLHPGSEIRLEVSSPGIERNLKSPREFEIFAGLGVRLLLEEESEWRRGVIVSTSQDSVDINSGDETERFLFSSIRRAKLDNSWEA